MSQLPDGAALEPPLGVRAAVKSYPSDGARGLRLVSERTALTRTAMLSTSATPACGWCGNERTAQSVISLIFGL